MQRDDHLTLFTRLALWPLAVLSAIFGPMLFLFPGHTDVTWSWQILPAMSAVVVGAGYIFGACSITTLLLRNQWHSLNIAVFATWAFSVAMALATLLHLDRFFVGTPRFYIWFLLYLLLPVALPVAWFFNRRYGAPRQPGEVVFHLPLRLGLLLLGVLLAALGVFMFAAPGAAAVFWPWRLTPLMSQVIGGWVLFVGAAAVVAFLEPRYSAYRALIPCAVVWGAALLIGSALHLADFDLRSLAPWVWFLSLFALTASTAAVLAVYEPIYRRRAKKRQPVI